MKNIKKQMLPTTKNSSICMYQCKICDKIYKHKSSFYRHKKLCDDAVIKGHECLSCGKIYKYRSNMYRHQKMCKNIFVNKIEMDSDEVDEDNIMNHNDNKHHIHHQDHNLEMREMRKMMMEIINENKHLQNKLVELAKEPKIINQHNNNNNIGNTKIENKHHFNIFHYLENDCKNAMNLTDFMDIVRKSVSYLDLDKLQMNGYINNIQEQLVCKLKDMEQTERPIQCTDTKRKQFYVKDDDCWNKDESHEKIEDMLKNVNDSHLKLLKNWTDEHPSWKEDETKTNKVNSILNEITSMYGVDGEHIKKKILQNLSKATMIDKKDGHLVE